MRFLKKGTGLIFKNVSRESRKKRKKNEIGLKNSVFGEKNRSEGGGGSSPFFDMGEEEGRP